MASNYAEITEYNERHLGLDTETRRTQISMYSDPTHFIFEILQNADDYKATEVSFTLSTHELVIEHNGEPFLEENVKAVTYFGWSTSRDDLFKTGRFGVGFKSVFAFSATPIIISGSEHFEIHGLYRIKEHPYPDDLPGGRTRITLPFNHETVEPNYVEHMPAVQAYEKILKRLSGLNMNTLLFTRNIAEIHWKTVDKSGHYLRDDKNSQGVRDTSITNGDEIVRYIVFTRTPTWEGKPYKDVEIAFRIDSKAQVTSVDEYLYVLFATTQETHLKFIINGPYQTNPSRETISEEDEFNCHLIKETCDLLESALPSLRDRGLLTVNSLTAMPIQADSLRDFYSPILDTAIKCFRRDDLVPTENGSFAPAAKVLQGPAAIREVITDKELAFLSDKQGVQWAKGVVSGSRAHQFLKSLDIEQWGWQDLEAALESKFNGYKILYSLASVDNDHLTWLESRNDQWLQKLYLLLADAIRNDECNRSALSRCRIIRTTESKKITYTSGASAYFPKGRGYTDLPQVKKSIMAGKTKQLTEKINDALIALGVSQIGDEERIDHILSTYYCDDAAVLAPEQHLAHMRIFIKAWKNDRSTTKFSNKSIFKVAGDGTLQAAGDCFLDSPLKCSGLKAIYNKVREGIPHRQKLWSRYQKLKEEGFCDFAGACGVEDKLTIVKQYTSKHPNHETLQQDRRYRKKFRWFEEDTKAAKNEDYTINGLDALLRLRDRAVNRLIWEAVRNAVPEVLCAVFQPSKKFDFREDKSSLVIILSNAEWIPDKRGKMRKPSAMTKAELHSSFRYDNRNGWLDAISFGEEAKQASEAFQRTKELVKQTGISIEIIETFSNLSKEKQAEYLEMIQKKKRADAKERKKQENAMPFHEAFKVAFVQSGGPQAEHESSDGRSKNPVRRKAKLVEEISEVLRGASSAEGRFTFVLKKWKAKNDQVKARLTGWYGGRCQICKRTFTQRNNQPYFEGLYLVPHTEAKWIDRAGNVLCLCPWHSAQFQFGSKEIEGDVMERILGFDPAAGGGCQKPEIALRLCGESITIGFHENHFLELQTMVEESLKIGR